MSHAEYVAIKMCCSCYTELRWLFGLLAYLSIFQKMFQIQHYKSKVLWFFLKGFFRMKPVSDGWQTLSLNVTSSNPARSQTEALTLTPQKGHTT